MITNRKYHEPTLWKGDLANLHVIFYICIEANDQEFFYLIENPSLKSQSETFFVLVKGDVNINDYYLT